MNKNIRRGVVALATTFASLVLVASPASAVSSPITGGTITFTSSNGVTTETFSVTGFTGAGCANSIQTSLTGSTTSITAWQMTTYSVVYRFVLAGTWYVFDETRTGSTAGTVTNVTTTSATLNSSTLSLRIDLFVATDQTFTSTSCAHGTTRICRFSAAALSQQGTYNGNIHNPTSSDTLTLTGSGTLGSITPPCGSPFTAFANGPVTISVTFHVN